MEIFIHSGFNIWCLIFNPLSMAKSGFCVAQRAPATFVVVLQRDVVLHQNVIKVLIKFSLKRTFKRITS